MSDATKTANLTALLARAMSRDEAVYPNPDRFLPERFLKDGNIDPNVRDPADFVFGFGRRYVQLVNFERYDRH